MPRGAIPCKFSCIQISFPVEASRATSELFLARTYITLPTISGFQTYEIVSLPGYDQATSSWPTFDFVIWFNSEKCELSGPPPLSDQALWFACAPAKPT